MLLALSQISKRFGVKTILDKVDLPITKKSKIAIVGLNGCGKSTLLKVVNEVESYESGEIIYSKKVDINYVGQESVFDDELTIFEVITQSCPKAADYEVKSILNQLGLTDHQKLVKTLSGGQKKRLGLAVGLLIPSDLLILDEPTNHLDLKMITWLENYLIKFNGAILLVTHDRYFLENVTNNIYELEAGILTNYEGSYHNYLEQKQINSQMQEASLRKLNKLYLNEKKWMMQGPKARSTKSVDRIKRFEKLAKDVKKSDSKSLSLSSNSTRLGSQTIEFKNVSKSFDLEIFSDFSYNFLPYDRVAILGENGAGKSTLLKMIMQSTDITSGELIIGSTVKFGYFGQELSEMDPNLKVIDYISQSIDPELLNVTPTSFLSDFLFDVSKQHQQIKYLSGGEKRRLELCKILISNPNVLILDEPTNDLDTQTLTILEDYLEDFFGIIIVVTHDRYFLDKVIDKIFYLENKTIKINNNDYDQLIIEQKTAKQKVVKAEKNKTEQLKLSYQEKKKLETIDDEIETCETRIAELDLQVAKYASDFTKLQDVLTKHQAASDELNELNDIWISLHSKVEQIDAQKR